ncbi:MAG TPA: hypothetical protein VMT38_00105 [Terracidiphilus sp.]|nr:hypothetical protein [Terracidiphilus sp.]
MLRAAFGVALACVALSALADKKPQQEVKPLAGPRATVLRITPLYISPDTNSERVLREQIGREMVVVEHSGSWTKVFVNTDIEEQTSERDAPMVGEDQAPPPITGWMETKGIVEETTPNGDQIVMGAAADEEALASNPRGPANAAESARLLYRRVAEMFPNSPLAPEAAWRAADIQWQMEKADASTLPSANERDPVYRMGMNEDPLRKVIKFYPRTRWAAFAAYDLIDNKLCGNWEGSTECPEKEADLYLKYASEYPDGPRTAQALYEAVYRYAVLKDMYDANGDGKKSENAHNQARNVAAQLKAHFADSDYTLRAGTLVYKLDEGVPVFGIERN